MTYDVLGGTLNPTRLLSSLSCAFLSSLIQLWGALKYVTVNNPSNA